MNVTGNLLFGGMGLKSTREKLARQQKTANQVEFWEQQKEHLKERECESVEEIADKLEAFHTYEDEIRAAKMAYNLEQMHHVLDEAQEIGEQIADAAEKLEPKTPEERREEAAKEAAGIEEEGMLDEMLEEILDETLESAEELAESAEELAESAEELTESVEELEDSVEMTLDGKIPEEEVSYMPIDIRI